MDPKIYLPLLKVFINTFVVMIQEYINVSVRQKDLFIFKFLNQILFLFQGFEDLGPPSSSSGAGAGGGGGGNGSSGDDEESSPVIEVSNTSNMDI